MKKHLIKRTSANLRVTKIIDEESPDLFKSFFELAFNQVAIMDTDFNFIYVNKPYAIADQKEVDYFKGKNHFDLYPSDAKPIFEEVIRTKQPFQAYARPFYYAQNPERGVTYWDISLIPVLTSTGEVNFLILSLYDVTKRVKAEQILQENEDRLLAFFELSPIPMIIINKKGKITQASDSFLTLFNLQKKIVLNRHIKSLKILGNQDYKEVLYKLLKHKNINNMELKFYKSSTQMGTGLFSATLLNIHNKEYFFFILNDITQIKAYESEMQRLDRLNLVGELAGSLAHEVRNPLTTVKGFLQLFEKNKYYIKKDTIGLLLNELERANLMINQFLSLGNNRPLAKEPLNLNNILKTLLPLLEADAIKNNHSIELKLTDIPSLPLNGNEIRQLILNLVKNGLDSMDNGGNIKITTYMANNKVVLSIKDHGKGIPLHDLDNIFTPFYSTKDTGTGLGLPICLSIAKKHNGRITVASNQDGTTFTVEFTVG